MAKSLYLPGVLFIAALFICSGAGSVYLKYQEAGIGNQDASRIAIRFRDPIDPKAAEVSRTIAMVKTVYNSQVGVREKGENRGAEVEKYLRYVGLAKGNPWCAAFVSWVYGQAGVRNPKTGWSPSLFPDSKIIWERGVSRKQFSASQVEMSIRQGSTSPKTGDIFALFFPEKNRIAHTGFIDTWDGTWLTTVEGNTNPSGGREGDGVYRKRRLVRSIYQAARYIN